MKTIIKIAISALMMHCFLFINCTNAQTELIIAGGNVNINGAYLVLNNAKLTNDGTLGASGGTATITGSGINALSALAGTSKSTFYNLTINKTSNGVQLESDIDISNQLTLTSGNIDIQGYDLTILNTGSISGGSSSSFIKTTGVGNVNQEVSASDVVFPVGNQSYTPLILSNVGTADYFSARVENTVYMNGVIGNVITTDVVNATWHIDEAISGGSDVTVFCQWNASDELTDFVRTQSFVSHYDNNQWNNGAMQAAFGFDPYVQVQSGLMTFSPFIVASDPNVLPVELLYFAAHKTENGVLINWETASEFNNDYFDVEWKIGGNQFEKIGRVKGAGTTTEIQYYEFLHDLDQVDIENGSATFYYRLKQMDFDGAFEYSDIASVQYVDALSLIHI